MGGEWRRLPLEDCMEAIIDYRGKTPKKTSSGIPLITAKIVKNGVILPVGEYISPSDYDSWMRRGMPREGDVLVTTEAPLGEVAQLDGRKVALAQRLIALRGKAGFLDNTFLKYQLQSNDVQSQLTSRATGTTVLGIKQSELRKISLPLPPIDEQRTIAHVLGSLDDKIELNRQLNQTLEQMAQAIFKSWFIDLDPVVYNAVQACNPVPERFQATAERYRQNPDIQTLPQHILDLFPDRFEESELGEIPAGWGVTPLASLIKLIGGGTPKTKVAEYWNGDIPWFSVVDAPADFDVWVIETEKHVTQKGVDNSSTKILPVGTTIISARGTVGKCALVGRPMAMNQSCYGVQPKPGYGALFINHMLRDQISSLQRSGHGSVFNTITRSTFESIKFVDCGEQLSELFDKAVEPFLSNMLQNQKESTTISKTRDALLPKLISGEVRVLETERFLEEVL